MNCKGLITVLVAPIPLADPDEACRLLSPVLGLLPDDQRRGILANRRPVDRALRLLVRVLLAWGLKLFGQAPEPVLAGLRLDGRGRPFSTVAEFNFSHSAPYGVCALAPPGWSGGLGVDVEGVRPLPSDDFRNVFTAGELGAIEASADADRELIRRWTVKEAVLKSTGVGFSGDPRPIPTDLAAEGRPHRGAVWRHLELEPGFALTVASAGAVDFQARLLRPGLMDYLNLFNQEGSKHERTS